MGSVLVGDWCFWACQGLLWPLITYTTAIWMQARPGKGSNGDLILFDLVYLLSSLCRSGRQARTNTSPVVKRPRFFGVCV